MREFMEGRSNVFRQEWTELQFAFGSFVVQFHVQYVRIQHFSFQHHDVIGSGR